MKTQPTRSHGYHRTNLSSLTRIAAFVALVALIGIPLFSSSSASSTRENSRALPIPRLVSDKGAAVNSNGIFGHFLNAGKRPALLPFSPALAETIATFAANCTTPKSSFVLGETVCAQTDGVDLGFPGGRWVHWLRQDLSIAYGGSGTTDITVNPQTFTFVPDALGTWKVTIAETLDPSQTPAVFTVSQTAPITTYAADCTTPKTLFNLGETVCAIAQGFDPAFNRRFAWIDPAGLVRRFDSIFSDPQTNSFTLPLTETSVIDIFVVDNRGTWKVNVVSSRGTQLASAPFTVQGAEARADLSIGKGIIGGSPDSATNFSYSISITNFGPNNAANVVLTDPQPANATFVSPVVQTSGPMSPGFLCSGSNPVVCTRLLGLAVGQSATFEITYTAGAAGATVTNVATVSSDTTELNNGDNTASSGRVTIGGDGGTPPTCTLDCPNDITTATNTAGGANVTFASPATFGDCGTVTTNHASGSFFPIGTTTVTATSPTGGGSCTFNVTVIDVPNPTISCPADKTEAAPSGATEVFVTTGSPTATGSGVTVRGLRSDSQHIDDPPSDFPGLTDPYPIGTTLITWTATDQYFRSASCIQKIIVTSLDAPTITCPLDRSIPAASGCQITLTAAQIGTPTTGGAASPPLEPCPVSNPCALRSDHLALTDPFPAGQTAITWTATNSIGSASCTEVITITTTGTGDTTPPTLTIPPDLNVTTNTCSALLDDELGVATATDNCTPAVNITRTGVPLTACTLPNICPIACPTVGNPGRTCFENFNFPTGTTTITYDAVDAAGNHTIKYQLVTVTESPAVPPTIIAPANAAYQCASQVPAANPSQATASDNCGTPTVTVSEVSSGAGSTASPLVITRTFTAKDASNNMTSAVQTITVIDNTPPTITCPADILNVHTDPGICAATVNPGSATASDNCSSPTIIGVRSDAQPLNALYPKGTTTITWTATDVAGNHSSCVQTITVIDVEPPTISCPADMIVDFDPAVNGATVNYTAPVGTDNCPGAMTVKTAGLLSGLFPVGTTTNTFMVTDAAGNTASCSFKVTVALTSIIGLNSVSISGAAIVDSYDSTGGYPATKGSLANILSNGTITIAGSGKVFGNVRSTRVGVAMSGASQVTGNATAGTTVSRTGSAIVGGTITNNALAPVMTLPSVPACGPPYSPNSGISGTYSYNSSTGDLSLSGVNIATLANGTYCFHNLTLTNSAQLKVNGPVTIKLTGQLNASGATSLSNTTAVPANLRILSSYSGSNGVIFSNGTSVYLLLYAPNTSVADTGAAPLFGTVVGKTVTLSNSGMIHYDTRLKTIWPDIWTLIFGP